MTDIETSSLIESTSTQNNSFGSFASGGGDNDVEERNELPTKSSLAQTTLNMIKMSIGTGVIGIPYAASEGGIIFHIIGLALVTIWNNYSIHRLVESRSYVLQHKKDEGDQKSEEPENTSTFGVMTWHAFGSAGLYFIDSVLALLMIGIIVAYEDAILGFAGDTKTFTTGSEGLDAIFLLIIMTPFLFLPNYESLAKVSALGTGLIFVIFIVFGGYGLHTNGLEGFHSLSKNNLWPQSFEAFSNWFGVAVFGYGVVPFTYSIQESMTEPKELMKATHASLIVVFLTYVVIGDIISIIFVQGIQSDIISELPTSSALPTVIRLLMIITVLTTVPLIIIPAGDLIHDKIIQRQKGAPPGKSVYIVRLLIAIFCALVSVEVPKFIYVISFVGCFCVALTSFAYPPLLHLKCLYKFCSVEKRNSKMKLILTDVILLCCGVLITGFTSVLTFKSMMDQMKERKLY